MTELQNVQYEILCKVDEVCKKHNIKYYLAGGTLLGAVRHKGFIPWDDDIDIDMPLTDYRRFLACAQTELGSDFFLLTPDTNEYEFRSFARVTKRNTTYMDPNMRDFRGNREIFIDIFPIAYFQNQNDADNRRKWLKVSNLILEKEVIRAQKKSGYRQEIFSYYGRPFLAALSIVYCLPHCIRKLIHDYSLKKVYGQVGVKPFWAEIWGQITDLYPMDLLEGESKTLLFETKEFPVFPKFKEYLQIQYGNYMQLPPESERRHVENFIIDCKNSYVSYIR